MKNFNIALDGPSGSGKSTVAKALSQKLNILYLDTGAMYRASALYAMQNGIDCTDEVSVKQIIENINIEIKYINGSQHTLLSSEDVSDKIRKNEVSMNASHISAHRCVREKMVELQRKIASEQSCVLDGRDIGTVVLPQAEFKFFIDATPYARAERRRKELVGRGQIVDFDKLLEEIKARDYNDSHRKLAPLKPAEDAIIIDTSLLSVEQVVNKILDIIGKKYVL